MSTESQKPLVFFLPPDLSAGLTAGDAFEAPRQRTAQEISDNAFASYGRLLLGFDRLSAIKNPDWEDLYAPSASLEDWECLESENPDLYHRLSRTAFAELDTQGIEAPFSPTLADVHSLDAARAKRIGEGFAAVIQNDPSSQPAVS